MSNPNDEQIYRRPTSVEPEQFLTHYRSTRSACPFWCSSGYAHHEFEQLLRSPDEFIRTHTHRVGGIDPLQSEPPTRASVAVEVVADNVLIVSENGSRVKDTPPAVALYLDQVGGGGRVLLTADEARRLMALLASGVAVLDSIASR